MAYAHMAADGVRMDAYARAIAKAVKPGHVVVDLGSGTGIFALLAAKAGARRVHAVETNPAVWLLRDLAAENGLSDRIQIHHASSFDVELPEPADVIVSDLRASYPLHDSVLASLRDARGRWLAANGVFLPSHDRLMVAAIEYERFWSVLERGWTSFERRGLSAAAARQAMVNSTYGDDGAPIMWSQVLTTTEAWAELRYGEDSQQVIHSSVELAVKRGGTAHAMALWFDATIIEGVGFSNAPGNELVYKRIILPFAAPIVLEVGDIVKLTLRVDVSGANWAWDTEVLRAAGPASQRFRQATFLGAPTSPEALLRESISSSPSLSARGDRARVVLELMDGKRTVGALADALATTTTASTREQLLAEVREHVRRYAR